MSRLGGGKSFKLGGKTAGLSEGIGHSNYGGIKVRGSCFTDISSYSLTASGTRFVSNLKRSSLKRVVKSFGRSSLSWRHDLSLSAMAVISGT